MSKIDQKYIDALDLFTESLQQIVDILKEQQKTGKADTVNEFLKTPFENLTEVIKELKNVTEKGFKDVKNDNKKILAKIESIKKQKESGMFENIEDPKNKSKILDGIKVVILIAAGVLAMGMAFKLIGKVDFLSVIALSTAMLFMAISFSKISKIEGLTLTKVLFSAAILPIMAAGLLISGLILRYFPKDINIKQMLSLTFIGLGLGLATALLVMAIKEVDISKNLKNIFLMPLTLPVIAFALLISGFILRKFPTITLAQGLSMLVVSGTVGLATYLLLKSIKDISLEDIGMVFFLPIVLPLIALGLLLSGAILSIFPTISLAQGLSMIVVGVTMGLTTFLLFSSLGKVNLIDGLAVILLLPIILPLIAVGLVGASIVLQFLKPLRNPFGLLLSSLVIGLSILFFVPAVYFLGKLDTKQILRGGLAIPYVAGGILAAAWIFKFLPDIMKYPTFQWSLFSGIAFLVFAPVVYFLGQLDNKKLRNGLISVPLLAAGITVTAWIFQLLPDNMKYPSWQWTLQVGLSLAIFGILVIEMSKISKGDLVKGLLGVVGISAVIFVVDYIIAEGSYEKYPSINWLLGVGLSIASFGLVSFLIGRFINANFWEGLAAIAAISAVILISSILLNMGKYEKYPSTDWLLGAGLSIGGFGLLALVIGIFTQTEAIFWMGLVGILAISAVILASDFIINLGKYQKYPSIDWIKGIGLSIGAFGLAAVVIGALMITGVGAVAMAAGLVSILAIAGTMLAVDTILNAGTFTKYPSEEWAKGVSKSMALFSGLGDTKGVGGAIKGVISGFIKGVGGAAISITLIPIARSMVEVDNILSQGKFDTYPSEEWVKGVTKSIALFSGLGETKGIGGAIKGVISGFIRGAGGAAISTTLIPIAHSMVEVDSILSQGKFDTYPSAEWVEGTFKSLKLYTDSISDISVKSKDFKSGNILLTQTILSISVVSKLLETVDVEKFYKSISTLMSAIQELNKISSFDLSKSQNFKIVFDNLSLLSSNVDNFLYEKQGIAGIFGGRKRDFDKFSDSIKNIVSAFQIIYSLKPLENNSINSYISAISEFNKLPQFKDIDAKANSINNLANSFLTLANSLNKVNENLQGFSNLSRGLFLISVIDDTKLDNVLKTVDKHKSTLQVINQIPEERSNILSVIKGLYETMNKKEPEKIVEDKKKDENLEKSKQKQFYNDISEIRSLLNEFRDYLSKPSVSGSFYK